MLLAGSTITSAEDTIYRPGDVFVRAIRGQNPTFYEDAVPGSPELNAPQNFGSPGEFGAPGELTAPGLYDQPGTVVTPPGQPLMPPPAGGSWNPFQPYPSSQDPFLQSPNGYYGAPPQGGFLPGVNGPQPYRFGWQTRFDVTWRPSESAVSDVMGSVGDFQQTDVDLEFRYTSPSWFDNWIWGFTQEVWYRSWQGPAGPIGVPGSAWHVGWDLELSTPGNAPWSYQLAFTPSLNADFDGSPTSEAWNFDARGIVFFQHSPQWMLALGLGYWDRVGDYLIPYAGVVWTPSDRWEFRILFPESRISYFLGNMHGHAKWLYVKYAYDIESYQITHSPAGIRDQMELRNQEVVGGVRMDNGWITTFIEAGFVFQRKLRFKQNYSGIDVSEGFIGRVGVRF